MVHTQLLDSDSYSSWVSDCLVVKWKHVAAMTSHRITSTHQVIIVVVQSGLPSMVLNRTHSTHE